MRSWLLGIAATWMVVAAGCVLGGPEEPGCEEDAECGEGYSCRAGACFRETSAAVVPVDGGDDPFEGGDDPLDGGDDADAD